MCGECVWYLFLGNRGPGLPAWAPRLPGWTDPGRGRGRSGPHLSRLCLWGVGGGNVVWWIWCSLERIVFGDLYSSPCCWLLPELRTIGEEASRLGWLTSEHRKPGVLSSGLHTLGLELYSFPPVSLQSVYSLSISALSTFIPSSSPYYPLPLFIFLFFFPLLPLPSPCLCLARMSALGDEALNKCWHSLVKWTQSASTYLLSTCKVQGWQTLWRSEAE